MNTHLPDATKPPVPQASRRGIQIRSFRDKPPIGKEMVSLILFFFDEDGEMHIAAILNTDGKKGEQFGLPGGMRKVEMESTLKAAQHEAYEEVGLEIPHTEIYPVMRFVKMSRMRDVNDHDTGKSGPVEQFIFAVPGERQLRNTSNREVRYPRWVSLRSVQAGRRDIFSVEEEGQYRGYHGMFISHLFVLLEGLREMGEKFSAFADGTLSRKEPGYRLYDDHLVPLARRSAAAHSTLDFLSTIDVDGIIKKYYPQYDSEGFHRNFTRYDAE